MKGDRKKILKAMQLALFGIRKLFPENDPNLEKLETYGILVYKRCFLYAMHWVGGVYLVDQFDGFVVPNTPIQSKNLSHIIRRMIIFKIRVVNLQQHIESSLKLKKFFKRGGTQHADDCIVDTSPQKKKSSFFDRYNVSRVMLSELLIHTLKKME
ncbi:12800_t:CDS:2 [Entrophospora sp. SA101]|nr:12800_t:CDS:2 [Entrophospora sp. SA101]